MGSPSRNGNCVLKGKEFEDMGDPPPATDAASILAGLLKDQETRLQKISPTDDITTVAEKLLKKKKLVVEGSFSCLNTAAVKCPFVYPAIIDAEGLAGTAQLQTYYRHFPQPQLAEHQCALIGGIANVLALTKGKVPIATVYEGLVPFLQVIDDQHTYLLTKQIAARVHLDNVAAKEVYNSLPSTYASKSEHEIATKVNAKKRMKKNIEGGPKRRLGGGSKRINKKNKKPNDKTDEGEE